MSNNIHDLDPEQLCRKFLPRFATKPEWVSQVCCDGSVLSVRGDYHSFQYQLGNPVKRSFSVHRNHYLTIAMAKRLEKEKTKVVMGFDQRDGQFTSFCLNERIGYAIKQKTKSQDQLNAIIFPDQYNIIGKIIKNFQNVAVDLSERLKVKGSTRRGNICLEVKQSKNSFYPSCVFHEGHYRMFVDDVEMSKLYKKSRVGNKKTDLVPVMNKKIQGEDRFGELLDKRFDGHEVSSIYRKTGYCGAFCSLTVQNEPIVFQWPDEEKLIHMLVIR